MQRFTSTDDHELDTVDWVAVKSFMALASFNDPTLPWDDWQENRHVLGRVLFGSLFMYDLKHSRTGAHDLVQCAMHSARMNLTEFHECLSKIPTQPDSNGIAHVTDLKNMVRIWNKALTAFYSTATTISPVEVRETTPSNHRY